MTGSLPRRRPLGQGRRLLVPFSLWIFTSALGCCSALDNPRIVEHPTDQYVAKNEPAKLNCKAEGDPKPFITWYRNGHKVTTNKEDHNAHRLIVEDGNLFFLRIIHAKNQKPDVGTYYCNATNIHGSAISRNATLQIAVLRDDFRQNPESVTVAAGETHAFHCKPPRGEPEPRIMWHKDGTAVMLSGRLTINSEGDLVITKIRSTDAGKYTCLAINQGGEKESDPAQLTVQEKPTFREMPEDKTVQENMTVELKCKATGDPPPKIQWRREKGRIPFGRARTLDDGTLRIEKVEVVDGGKYVCEAHNTAGFVEAVGKVIVETGPTFLVRPSNLSVAKGRTATLQCVVTGNPLPTVFWSTGNEQNLMFANSDNGRFNVSSDGTLRIESVEYSDGTEYTCQALSPLGSSKAKAVLTVVAHDKRPPPIIIQGPQNQTLEPQELALLTCKAEGKPPPTVRWYHNNMPLIYTDPRFMFLNSGTLQISDVQYEDSGQYTCRAISETGETEWTAYLSVSKQGPFLRSQKPSALPGPPSKPQISEITDTSVHLNWTPSSQNGQSPTTNYIVEYFSPETSEGWEIGTDSVTRSEFTVRSLRPETNYLFVIRAKNAVGTGPPSTMSEYIRTREKRTNFAVNLPREEIERKFQAIRIEMKTADPLNTTAIRAKWEVSEGSLTAIEGYIVNYTEIIDLKAMKLGPSRAVRVPDPYQYGGTVGNLRVFTTYKVCVSAYAQDVTSPCSKSMTVRTKESVPSAPPTNIVINKDGTTLRVKWSPPEEQFQNGNIVGYDVDCVATEGTVKGANCSVSTLGPDTRVTIQHTQDSGNYKLRIAARTAVGRGEWSMYISMGPEQTTIISEPWFLWLLGGTIVGGVCLALCVFSIYMCRKKRRNKKKMVQNGMYSAVPVHKSEESNRGGTVISREDVMYSQKEGNVHAYGGLQSDLASLLECGAHKDPNATDGSQLYSSTGMPQMKTFYQKPSQSVASSVAPYATTTLINKGVNPGVPRPSQSSNATEPGFRPINHAYVHSSASGSGDSCQKGELRSSDTDNSRPNTAAGCPHDHCEGLTSPGSDSGSLTTDDNGIPVKRNHKYSKIGGGSCSNCGKQPMVNWAELLPPPPEHPPPNEMGSPADSSSEQMLRHNCNIAETRFINNRSPISPVSKMSACSCPIPHDRMVAGMRGGAPVPYSDIEYPTHPGPAHMRYHGEKAYQDVGGGGSGSGGSQYNSDSPKPLNVMRGQTDALLHRCQSPLSCHNCGSSIQHAPQGGSGAAPSSSSSSSYGGHSHLPHHHAIHPDNIMTMSQHGMYPALGGPGFPPQMAGPVSTAYPHQGAGPMPVMATPSSYPYTPASLHGYRLAPLEASDQRNSSDLEGVQGHLYQTVGGASSVEGGPQMDRACQSSLPSLANECLQQNYNIRIDSPEGAQDYAGESDMDGHRTTDCPTPDSSVNGDGSVSAGSMQAGWPSVAEDSSDDVLSHDGDEDNLRCHDNDDDDQMTSDSSGSSFLADTDFASAVARAAELSGLTVVGTTVSADPKAGGNKKYRKTRNMTARPSSPYSTDSNMSAVVHKPYPKSERKKQLLEQARKYGQRRDGGSMQEADLEEQELEIPSYYPPYYPTFPLHPNHHHFPLFNNNNNNGSIHRSGNYSDCGGGGGDLEGSKVSVSSPTPYYHQLLPLPPMPETSGSDPQPFALQPPHSQPPPPSQPSFVNADIPIV